MLRSALGRQAGLLVALLASSAFVACSSDGPEPSADAEVDVSADAEDAAEDSADTPEDSADTPEDSADVDPDSEPDADADATTGPDGAALYQLYCAFCHGDEGQGYISDNANALAQQEFLATASDEFLTLATVHGRPGTPMSAWGVEKSGPLTDDDVAAIVALIRGWQTVPSLELSEEPIDGSDLRGRGAYNANCAGCHGEDGEGETAISLNNPWFLETASDEFIAYAIAEGRPGTPMPAYSDRLPERTINDITALIRSWQVPVDSDPIPPYEPDLDAALLNPDGANPEWELREDRFVSIHDVQASLEAGEALILIDARPTADFLTSHITGAQNLPFYQIGDYIDQLPQDRWIVTYCGCPHAVSGQAADALLAAGFTNVAVLDEGFYEWEDAGYPVTVAE